MPSYVQLLQRLDFLGADCIGGLLIPIGRGDRKYTRTKSEKARLKRPITKMRCWCWYCFGERLLMRLFGEMNCD